MEIYSTLVTGFLGVLTLVLLYVLYMSRQYTIFKKMGVKQLTPWPALGSFPTLIKHGFMDFHTIMYKKFPGEKMYGFFEAAKPVLVIKDLDVLREVMVKNFNSFVNRRVFNTEEPFSNALTMIKDDHWRHVRTSLSPAFSSGKLKRMGLLVEQTAKSLNSNISKACRDGKDVELKHVCGCYTMDVIANTGFGVQIDSLNDEESQFVTEAKRMMNFGDTLLGVVLLFPTLFKLLLKLGFGFFPKQSINFFNSFLDAAMENRKSADSNGPKRYDFVQLMAAEEEKQLAASRIQNGSVTVDGTQERKGLSRKEVQGQAFIFILAGYDTVSNALSFCLYILAHEPNHRRKIQEELDEVLAGKPPTHENVNDLVYLDMCLNEAIRMYPPGFIIDRECTQDCEVDGVMIPKGMVIIIPCMALHNDPELFPNPEEFDPERFTPENKASRHPFAFLPFGQGPRNCIGMRLALMEMKMAIASLLQEMTPVPCSKSVYPPRLGKFRMNAEDGLWVKWVSRKEERNSA